MSLRLMPIFKKCAGEGFGVHAQDSESNSDVEQAEGLTLEKKDLSLEAILDEIHYLGENYPALACDLMRGVLEREMFIEPEIVTFLKDYKRSLVEGTGLEEDKPSLQPSFADTTTPEPDVKPSVSVVPRTPSLFS